MLPDDSSNYVTAVAHYYRAEMGRMIAWRDRLDHTTNWAIAATAAMLSVTLSSPSSHHAVILCCMALVFLLLRIEARRYRFFALSRSRTRLMERSYYARVFARPGAGTASWREPLAKDLESPGFTMTTTEAMGNRLRRNYIWIYLTLLVSWWLKVTTIVLNARAGEAEFVHSFGQFLRNASVSYVPGLPVVLAVLVFFAWLMKLVLFDREELNESHVDEADL